MVPDDVTTLRPLSRRYRLSGQLSVALETAVAESVPECGDRTVAEIVVIGVGGPAKALISRSGSLTGQCGATRTSATGAPSSECRSAVATGP